MKGRRKPWCFIQAVKDMAVGRIAGHGEFFVANKGGLAAHPADPNKPILISDVVAQYKVRAGRPVPKGKMATAHAEIGVIQQAYDAGITTGSTMRIRVTGKDICSYCRSDIRHAADQAGLARLEVYEVSTGSTYVTIRNPDNTMSNWSITQ